MHSLRNSKFSLDTVKCVMLSKAIETGILEDHLYPVEFSDLAYCTISNVVQSTGRFID